MPVDYTSDLGKVRAAIPDISDNPVLTDDQITAFLSVAEDNIYGALALALRAIATETNLLYKYVKTDDFLVDGPKMAETLIKVAEANEKKAATSEAGGFFTIVPGGFTLEESWGYLEAL